MKSGIVGSLGCDRSERSTSYYRNMLVLASWMLRPIRCAVTLPTTAPRDHPVWSIDFSRIAAHPVSTDWNF